MVNKMDAAVVNCANFLLANPNKYISDIVFVKVGDSEIDVQFFSELEESLNNYTSMQISNYGFSGEILKIPNIHFSVNKLEHSETLSLIRMHKKVILIVEEYVTKSEQLLKAQKVVKQLSGDVLGVLYVS